MPIEDNIVTQENIKNLAARFDEAVKSRLSVCRASRVQEMLSAEHYGRFLRKEMILFYAISLHPHPY
ncbi:hypothetical protein [Nitrosomonas aestuarii]|uniref:hypothetical protein n=1 Tax=Nitrosomonas aestuarii TaxID=52441 RepID=UPI0011B24BB5|nr:hypothetical protein [Nitrosomonas aestuarii]